MWLSWYHGNNIMLSRPSHRFAAHQFHRSSYNCQAITGLSLKHHQSIHTDSHRQQYSHYHFLRLYDSSTAATQRAKQRKHKKHHPAKRTLLGALDVVNSANEKWLSGEEGVDEEEEEGAGDGVEAEDFWGAHDVIFCCLLLLILHENSSYVRFEFELRGDRSRQIFIIRNFWIFRGTGTLDRAKKERGRRRRRRNERKARTLILLITLL